MVKPARFAYTPATDSLASLMPRLPLILIYGGQAINVLGLLDTGAVINVLPYQIGVALGAVWEKQPVIPPLAGNLAHLEARSLVVAAVHPQVTGNLAVKLAFAWTRATNAPVIFGQINFFQTFNVCFYRTQGVFEIHPQESP